VNDSLPKRVRIPLIAVLSLHWLLAALIGLASLTCTGWAVDSNNRALLAFRLSGYLGMSGGALIAGIKHRYLASACLMVGAGIFYVWLETGWLFLQPASGLPSTFAMLPFLIALVVLLAPYSPAAKASLETRRVAT
jgi:hypothetical protein